MNLAVFQTRMQHQLKSAIRARLRWYAPRNRAKTENQIQTDLIREVVELHLSKPYNRKTAS